MSKIKTVTIGIPAYNESRNIRRLLGALIKQKEGNFIIKKIIVISDGSSDGTVDEVKKINDKRIQVIAKTKRQGKTVALNYLFKNSNTDYLILMDADVLPNSNYFVSRIVQGFDRPTVGLVCTKPVSVKEKTFFEKIISNSQKIKLQLNELLEESNQVYLANGRSLGLSRNLYQKVVLPVGVIADDAYIFFTCLKLKLKIHYSNNAIVLYRSPGNFSDHMKQSIRFYNSQKQLSQFFDKQVIKSQYSINKVIYIKALISGLLMNPVNTFCYAFILLYAMILSLGKIKMTHLWSPSLSSKDI